MQWVLNNNLYIAGDIEGALLGNMFSDVLSPYESLETMKTIRGIDIGKKTIYQKSFIDSSRNETILLSQTKNEEFMKEISLSEDVNKKRILSKNNFHLTQEVQNNLLQFDKNNFNYGYKEDYIDIVENKFIFSCTYSAEVIKFK